MKPYAATFAIVLLAGCSSEKKSEYFQVDPATAAIVAGHVTWDGKVPKSATVDMSEDPACVEAHKQGRFDGPVVVGKDGSLANVFLYIKSGLEGKQFQPPTSLAVIDQHGCWFEPRIVGLQTGQVLQVRNSDPVTHNIHPLAEVNREWNHSQGQGDAPIRRKFLKREVMIRVKCNIHSWMRAYLGVVEHPYFAVSKSDGTFEIHNLPPGDYVLAAWHETGGEQERKIHVPPAGRVTADFQFRGQ